MFASLPMYDLPELRPSTDALWQLIRARLADHGMEAPAHLARDTDPHEDWFRPDLVLSQTCGLPFVRELQGRVQLLGSPSCDIDCGAGSYYSVIIAKKDAKADLASLASGRLACNDYRSQSGFSAWFHHAGVAGLDAPSGIVITGRHLSSIDAVADGRADFAAIDAVTWALAERHHGPAGRVQVVARTEPMPALPYITSLANAENADIMRRAISEAIAGLGEKDRNALLITGFVSRNESDYQPIADAWKAHGSRYLKRAGKTG